MRAVCFIFSILSIALCFADAFRIQAAEPPIIEWQRVLGNPAAGFGLFGVKVRVAANGYIIAARYKEINESRYQPVLIKTNEMGQSEWERVLPWSARGYRLDVRCTRDGGYICGVANDVGEVCLIKMDELGNQVWLRSFPGFSSGADVSEIRQTEDGGWILCVSEHLFAPQAIHLIRTDRDGNLIWHKGFGEQNGEAYGVVQTPDGGFMVCGQYSGPIDLYLLKTNENGEKLWDRNLGTWKEGFAMELDSDGGFLIGGCQRRVGPGYLIKTDAEGNSIWERPHIEIMYSIQRTRDGGIVAAGRTENGDGASIMKADATGVLLWRVMGLGTSTSMRTVQQARDGGYIAVGTVGTYPGGPPYIKLVKLAPDEPVLKARPAWRQYP